MGNFVTDFFSSVLGWVTGTDFEEERGLEFTKEDTSVRRIPVVYGTRKIDNPIEVYASGSGDENRWLYLCYVLCEGEIEAIDEVFLDDKPADQFGSSAIGYEGSLGAYTGNTKVVIDKYRGTDTQTASALFTGSLADWTSNHRLRGRAYLSIRLRYDDELFTGVPKVTAIVRGRKVYDPRTTTTYHSANPALCLRDYLTSSRYGKGLDVSSIDDVAFETAADDLESTESAYVATSFGSPDTVTNVGTVYFLTWNTKPANAFVEVGSTVQDAASSPAKVATYLWGKNDVKWISAPDNAFTVAVEMVSGSPFVATDTIYGDGSALIIGQCNAIIDTSKSVFDNVKTLLGGMRGLLPFIQGTYSLIIEKDRASVFDVDESNIVSGISFKQPNKKDKYNRVTATFKSPNNNWKDDLAIFPDPGGATETSLIAEDNGTELHHEISLPTVTSYYLARELARLVLYKSRNALQCNFIATSELLAYSPGEIITITHTTPAWVQKKFLIVDMDLGYDGEVKVSCIEHSASIWAYDSVPLHLLKDDTNLPDATSVVAPLNLVLTVATDLQDDGTLVPALQVEFDESLDAFAEKHELQWKKSTDTVYESLFMTTAEKTLSPLGYLLTYDVRVRAWNTVNKKSAWLTGSKTLTADTTAPSVPGSPSATAGVQQVTLKWTSPTESDLRWIDVYQNTTNSIPGSSSYRVTGDTFTVPDLNASQIYYFWLKAVDNVGNESAATASVNATTSAITDEGANWSEVIDDDELRPDDGATATGASNINLDPGMDLADASTVADAYYDLTYPLGDGVIEIDSTGGSDSGPCLKITADTTTQFVISKLHTPAGITHYIPARQGDKFFASCKLFISTTFNGTLTSDFQVRMDEVDKDLVNTGENGSLIRWDATTKNSWQDVTTGDYQADGYATVAHADTRYIKVLIFVSSPATAGFAKIDALNIWQILGLLSLKESADWETLVTGNGKPANYATVGASVIIDPTFDRANATAAGFWSRGTGITINATNGANGGPCIVGTPNGVDWIKSEMLDESDSSVYVPVREGDRHFLQCSRWVTPAYDHNVEGSSWVRLRYWDETKTHLAYGSPVCRWDGTTKTAWQTTDSSNIAAGYVTAPSGAAFYTVELIIANIAATAGAVRIDNVVVQQVMGGLGTKDTAANGDVDDLFLPNASGQNFLAGNTAGDSITTGTDNVLIGLNSGTAITEGNDNTGIGENSLPALTTGDENIAIGRLAAEDLTIGNANVFIGLRAGGGVTTSSNTIAIGSGAGRNASGATTGDDNIIMGVAAASALTSGQQNVIVGTLSALAMNTGSFNVGIGYDTLARATSGAFNVAIGINSGDDITTGDYNVAVGPVSMAGSASVTGDNNTCVGHGTGTALTSGNNNTFIGNAAGQVVTTGRYNTAIGMNSLQTATTVDETTAVGMKALNGLTTGAGNVAVGFEAMKTATTATFSTAIGYGALDAQTTVSGFGNFCTAVGSHALGAVTVGEVNVGVGSNAGLTITTGDKNTCIGINSDVSTADAANQTALGYGAVCTSDNQVTLGNSNVTDLKCYDTSISSPSDIRDKVDVEPLTLGLSFILDLHPVTYHLNPRARYYDEVAPGEREFNKDDYLAATRKNNAARTGFIAQQVPAGFTGVDESHDEHGNEQLVFRMGELIGPLVKAVQELTARVEELENGH